MIRKWVPILPRFPWRIFICENTKKPPIGREKGLNAPGAGIMVYPFLISALGHLGRLSEANGSITEFRKRHPNANYSFFRDSFPTSDKDCLDHLIDGLHKAGLLNER